MIKIKDFIGKFSFLYGKTKGAVKLPQKTAWLKKKFLERDAGVYCRSNQQSHATFAA